MTMCNKIYQILSNSDKETMRIEFKKSDKLRSPEGIREIAYEIVALANRYGGVLLIGIKNNATFEGKGIFNDKDADYYKGIIDNICHNNISPVIECNIEFVRCKDSDVIVVNIHRRKRIPHAYIVSRKGPDIKNRVYYIRTNYGKRLVSDRQLEWLFTHQGNPDFTLPFRIVIHQYRESLKIPSIIEQPNCISNYIGFMNGIPENDIKRLTGDWNTLQSFFIEITPYAFIHSFSWLFSHSWLIEIKRYSECQL